jgi:hypothetical protein
MCDEPATLQLLPVELNFLDVKGMIGARVA